MFLVLSDVEIQGECCLLCQMIKVRVSVVYLYEDKDQSKCCLLCQMIKARVSNGSSVRF